MAFTTSNQETEWALFLQPCSSHLAAMPVIYQLTASYKVP